MLDFAAARKANVIPSGDLARDAKLFSGIGPA
jgi:quinolinate synthase